MKLDKNRILKTVERIKEGKETKDTLRKLLGGERLDDIFDEGTQKALLDNIIDSGKIHNMMPDGTGLDVLEGLVNNEIKGDLSNFYMIKPDYILQLSPEQQKNMSESISYGKKDLSRALQNLWSRGIRTEACTTKSSDNIPMLQLNIKADELENQTIVQQLYEQEGIEATFYFGGYGENVFHINLFGDKLYDYLQGDSIPVVKVQKENIFENAMRENLRFCEDMNKSYIKNGMDTEEVEKEIVASKKWLREFENRQKKIDENEEQEMLRQEKRKEWEIKPEMQKEIQRESEQIARKYREKDQLSKNKNQLYQGNGKEAEEDMQV